MKREYSKTLRKIFPAEVADLLPDFIPAKIDTPSLGSNEFVFRKHYPTHDRLHSFVIVVIDTKSDAFTIEIAGSTCGRFPELFQRPSVTPPLPDPVSAGHEFVYRLSHVAHGEDNWWHVEPELQLSSASQILSYLSRQMHAATTQQADEEVRPLVKKAIGELLQYGIPYLDQWAAKRIAEI